MDSHFFSSVSAADCFDGNEGVEDLPFSLTGLLAGGAGEESQRGILDLFKEEGVVRP